MDIFSDVWDEVKSLGDQAVDSFRQITELADMSQDMIGTLSKTLSLPVDKTTSLFQSIEEGGVHVSGPILNGLTVGGNYVAEGTMMMKDGVVEFVDELEAQVCEISVGLALSSLYTLSAAGDKRMQLSMGAFAALCVNEVKAEVVSQAATLVAYSISPLLWQIPNTSRAFGNEENMRRFIAYSLQRVAGHEKSRNLLIGTAGQFLIGYLIEMLSEAICRQRFPDDFVNAYSTFEKLSALPSVQVSVPQLGNQSSATLQMNASFTVPPFGDLPVNDVQWVYLRDLKHNCCLVAGDNDDGQVYHQPDNQRPNAQWCLVPTTLPNIFSLYDAKHKKFLVASDSYDGYVHHQDRQGRLNAYWRLIPNDTNGAFQLVDLLHNKSLVAGDTYSNLVYHQDGKGRLNSYWRIMPVNKLPPVKSLSYFNGINNSIEVLAILKNGRVSFGSESTAPTDLSIFQKLTNVVEAAVCVNTNKQTLLFLVHNTGMFSHLWFDGNWHCTPGFMGVTQAAKVEACLSQYGEPLVFITKQNGSVDHLWLTRNSEWHKQEAFLKINDVVSITACLNPSGNTEVFYVKRDGTISESWLAGGWAKADNFMGVQGAAQVVACANTNKNQEVFVVKQDGTVDAIWYAFKDKWYRSANFMGITGAISASVCMNGNGCMEVFFPLKNGTVDHAWFANNVWNKESGFMGIAHVVNISSAVKAMKNPYVFFADLTNTLTCACFDGKWYGTNVNIVA